ncbi:MAG TPA: cytochrome b5 domain-containing protein [Clostridia bacterium]
MKTFTKEELKKYDGQNGNPAYVAVDGVVYDVTNEKSWKGGKHQGIRAGNDVSEAIKSSPHGLEPLKKLPVVGKLAG